MGKDLLGKELGQGLSQNKKGLYEACYRDKDGKRHKKRSKNLAEVKEWLIDARYNDQHGVMDNYRGITVINRIETPSASYMHWPNVTVDDWFDRWLFEIKGDSIRYGTRKAYINRYKSRIKPVIGHMIVCAVRPIDCQRAINFAQDDDESEWSLKKMRVIMKAFFEAAVDNGLCESNPVTKTVKIAKHEKKERRVLTLEEQNRFLEAAKKMTHYDVFRFVLETGLRGGELNGLLWENVDFDNNIIRVEHSLDYRTDTKEFVNNPPKSHSGYRTIPLTKTARDILIKKQAEQENMRIPDECIGFVFLNKNGNHTHRGVYNRALHEVSDKLGMERFSMHSLRHTFATRCIESGMRPKTLQKIMGHSELSITMDLYVHVTDDAIEDEMRKFERHFMDDSGDEVA